MATLYVSILCQGMLRNSCLFFHRIESSLNFSASVGGGGGSVTLVMRYAVEASARP
jgi:hypothetical protein